MKKWMWFKAIDTNKVREESENVISLSWKLLEILLLMLDWMNTSSPSAPLGTKLCYRATHKWPGDKSKCFSSLQVKFLDLPSNPRNNCSKEEPRIKNNSLALLNWPKYELKLGKNSIYLEKKRGQDSHQKHMEELLQHFETQASESRERTQLSQLVLFE